VGSFAMHFTSNHDENSWNGTEYERLGDAVKTMAALSFTVPGMPLIYTGQEAGLNKRLDFFDKDQVDWSKLEMQDFYKKLIQLKKDNPALWNGSAGGYLHFLRVAEQNGIVAFTRQKDDNKIIVVMNLTQEPQENEVLCCSYSGKYIELFQGDEIDLDEDKIVKLDGWQFKIFVAQTLE
jgi:glycosidase